MPSTLSILITLSQLFFSLWPVLLLTPLSARKPKAVLVSMLVAWIFLAIVRVLIVFSPESFPGLIFPEPLNTTLFVLTGVGLFAFYFLRRLRNKRRFDLKLESVRSAPDLMDLSPVEFENMVIELLTASGHKAKRTGKSGDHGVDIVVQAKNGEKWIVQCKRWRATVGEGVIRDFYGTIQHEKADRGILVTSARFSRPAQAWAKGKPLKLYDGDLLMSSWKRLKSRKQQLPVLSRTDQA